MHTESSIKTNLESKSFCAIEKLFISHINRKIITKKRNKLELNTIKYKLMKTIT